MVPTTGPGSPIGAPPLTPAARPSWRLWAGVAVFVGAVGIGGYLLTGTPDHAELQAMAAAEIEAAALADRAETLARGDPRHVLAGEPTRLLERSLALDPFQPKALALAGAAAFERGDFAAAVAHWQRLLNISPADAGYREELEQGIARARAAQRDAGASAPPR